MGERERVCVYVCVRERGGGGEREPERGLVCVRERESDCVCVREREIVCVSVGVVGWGGRESERGRVGRSILGGPASGVRRARLGSWARPLLKDSTDVGAIGLSPLPIAQGSLSL